MLRYQLPDSQAAERVEIDAEFRAVSAALSRLAIRAARVLLRVERTGTHIFSGAASVADYAERRGMSAASARKYLLLGRALVDCPSLEADVERGRVPVDSAALLGEVAGECEAFRRPNDKWAEWARTMTTRRLRHLVAERRDETRAEEPVILVTAYVSQPVKNEIDRAVVITSRRAHMRLTLGQTLGMVVNDWLEDHDELRRTGGKRRLPDTATIPNSRTVPAEVNRHVRARTGDRCIVPFCDNDIWLHRSHRVPHAKGGSREAEGLDLLCDYHHLLYEKELIGITGSADAPEITDPDGRPMNARIPLRSDADARPMWRRPETMDADVGGVTAPPDASAGDGLEDRPQNLRPPEGPAAGAETRSSDEVVSSSEPPSAAPSPERDSRSRPTPREPSEDEP